MREITLVFLLFLFFPVMSIYSQDDLPFQYKAKYEEFLAKKADDVLVKILGPNQAKVIIETVMDFTKTEKVEYEKDKKKEKTSFKMEGEAGDISAIEYLMPGFGIPGAESKNENKSYVKQFSYPRFFIQKIKATILVNKSLSEEEILNIQNMVSEILTLDRKRGDEMVVVRAIFAPFWKTIWYNPESMNFIVKYVILSILGVIGLLVVAAGFLKLAGAMNTMTKVQQSHQITMDLAGGSPLPGQNQNLGTLSFIEEKKDEKEKKEHEPRVSDDKIYFDIKPHQIDALVSIMVNEDPSNVAIVADHLREDVKKDFFARLPPDFAADVVAGLSKMRFLENDVVLKFKDELETRLSGVMGGLQNALSVFQRLSARGKSEMIKNLEQKHPQLSLELRKRVFIFEDIKLLDDNDLSLLVSAVDINDLTKVYKVIDEEFKSKIKSQLSQTAWRIIEERNLYESYSEEKIDDSINNISAQANKLFEDGKIKKPDIQSEYAAIEANNEIVPLKKLQDAGNT
ncbi:MAG: hypothetical protein HY746_09375 [Elusimicrobia bacterium]|nr:hypothetical protein [Elusimicrobiota bacterium]